MKLCRQLSYRHSLIPGLCVFTWIDKEGAKHPLEISGIKVVGTKDGFTEAYTGKSEIKASATKSALAMGNPHQIEFCYVPPSSKSISCQFSLRVEANCMSPHVANDLVVKEELIKFISAYANKRGLQYLAKKYAMNICNGRWLWHNQNTRNTIISITTSAGLNFKINKVHQRRFSQDWSDIEENINSLVNEIHNAFVDPKNYCFIEVEARLDLDIGMEVFPSQAFTDKDESTKSSKTLQSIDINGVRSAIFGCFKVGAAIQMIDDWYPGADKPIRVSSYGVDKENVTTHRHPDTGVDLYSILINIESITEEVLNTELSGFDLPTDAHYLAACLIKGGLFQHGGSL